MIKNTVFARNISLEMKSIMEENQIVETLSILLYSRTLDTLYLEVFDAQNKNLISKLHINTSSHVCLNLAMPLNRLQIMVKKNQENIHILHQFSFRGQDFAHNSTLEHMENYVKMKKKFDHFSLLFQIFYRLNSSSQLAAIQSDLQPEIPEKPLRQSEQQKILQNLNSIKQIAQTNLSLLTIKAINTVFKSRCKKISLPSEQSMAQSRTFRKRKDKKTFTSNSRMTNLRKQQINKTQLTPTGIKYKNRARSEKQVFDCTVYKEDSFLEESFTGNSQTAMKKSSQHAFMMRKTKKTLGKFNDENQKLQMIQKSLAKQSKQSLAEENQQKSQIMFRDQTISIGSKCGERQPIFKMRPSCNGPIDEQKADQLSKSIKSALKQTSEDENNQFIEGRRKESRLFREVQIRKENMYENLKMLCNNKASSSLRKQRQSSHWRVKSIEREVDEENMSHDLTLEPSGDLSLLKKCSNLTKFSKLSRQSVRKPTCKFKQNFYEDLYLKTLESIQNQSQILKYVETNCQKFNTLSETRKKTLETVLSKEKENYHVQQNSLALSRQQQVLLQKKKKAHKIQLLKIQNLSSPTRYQNC